MASDRDKHNDEDKIITSTELKYILETNQKAISIYLEVEQQNEQIILALDKLNLKIEIIEKNAEDTLLSAHETEDIIKKIEKHMFRLIIILSSAGAGLIYTIIQSFFHH